MAALAGVCEKEESLRDIAEFYVSVEIANKTESSQNVAEFYFDVEVAETGSSLSLSLSFADAGGATDPRAAGAFELERRAGFAKNDSNNSNNTTSNIGAYIYIYIYIRIYIYIYIYIYMCFNPRLSEVHK